MCGVRTHGGSWNLGTLERGHYDHFVLSICGGVLVPFGAWNLGTGQFDTLVLVCNCSVSTPFEIKKIMESTLGADLKKKSVFL